MSQVPIQVGPYRPVTMYDAPEVLFTQLLDGELRPSSVSRTLLRPDELSPSERDTIAERLSRAAGNSKIVKTLADVALNPWTWFFFLTSPLGSKRVASLFKLHEGYSPYVAEKAPMLSHWGMYSAQQAKRGTRIGEAVARHADGMVEALGSDAAQAAAKRWGEVQEAHGLKSFNPEDYSPGSPQWTAANELQAAMHGVTINAEQAVVERQMAYSRTKAAKAGTKGVPTSVEIPRGPMATTDLRAILKKYGAEDLLPLTKAAMLDSATRVFGSPENVVKLWNAAKRSGQGNKMVHTVLGDASAAMRKGDLTLEEFKQAIRDHYIDPIVAQNGFYSPRNVSSVYLNGKEVKDGTDAAKWASTMRATGSAAPRGLKGATWHPDDLRRYMSVVGSTPELEAQIARGDAMMAKSHEGVAVRLLRIDPEQSFSKYLVNNARTYASFVQDVGEGVRRADREMVRDLGGKIKVQVPLSSVKDARHTAPLGVKKGAPITMGITEAEKAGLAPTGGFSLADVLYADAVTAANPWTRATINHSVVPRLMGHLTDDRAFTEAAVLASKNTMARFLGTDAAKAVKNSGTFGDQFYRRMEQYANPETAFRDARAMERMTLKTLYSAGLGANVPTAIINMTQPFMVAGNLVGFNHLIKAYGEAFKDFGTYFQERAAQGFRVLTPAERTGLYRRSFRMMNYNGHDTLDLAGDVLENFEGNILKGLTAQHRTKGMAERLFFDMPMTLFTQSEILNRNVVAHAARLRDEAMIAGGVHITPEVMVDNARGLVRETQFGAHWMNTPQSFLPESPKLGIPWGRWFANPLVRQYMMYPVRTVATWAHTVPRMGGASPSEAWRTWLNAGVRAMAVSAIGVQVARDLTGADVERAGFIASITDLVPGFNGGRFDGREGPLPVPPIIDSAYNILKSGFTGDAELFKRTLPRILPAGSALSRIFKSAPDMGLLGLGQTQYADWTHMQGGKVPIYKDDGTLVEMRNPAEVVLKGLGVDMGSYKDESQFMGFLVKQRDQVNDVRRAYMQKLMSGDSSGAESLASEYERRWKVPLTVTKGQIRTFMDNRETPRAQRQVGSMPQDLRSQYEAVRGATLGPTMRARPAYQAPVANGVHITPEMVALIQREIAKQRVPDPRNAAATTDERWGPFNLPDIRQ